MSWRCFAGAPCATMRVSGRAGYVSDEGDDSWVRREWSWERVSTATSTTLRVLSVVFASGALICMGYAIAGMVNHRQSPLTGYLLRLGALVCFAIAVALNVIAH
jgi:hypothetical protein